MQIGFIYYRYILFQTLRRFFSILLVLYFLYSLVDYSIHMQEFSSLESFSLTELILYYSYTLSKRLEFLIPLSFLFSAIRTLLSLNEKKELIGFLASGFSTKKLSSPLFALALLSSIIMLVNFQFVVPKARSFIDEYEKQFLSQREKIEDTESNLQTKKLTNHTKLLFLADKKNENTIKDLYWIESVNSIWHIKTLQIDTEKPIGHYVDHFSRDKSGNLVKSRSFDQYIFEDMPYKEGFIIEKKLHAENKSIIDLATTILKKNYTIKEERLELESYLYYKMVMPFIPFFILMLIIPVSMSYSRNKKSFVIYSLSFFGYICFFTIMDACAILSKGNILSPIIAISIIPFSLTVIGYYRLSHFYGREKHKKIAS